MKNVALAVSVLISVTMVACSGGTPTSPSQVTSEFSPLTVNRTVTTGVTVATGNLTGFDGEYATAEANSNYTLIQWGILAEQRGDTLVVKTFARQLVQDFTTAQEQLSEWAGADTARRGTFSAADKTTYDTLRGLSGSSLDRAFVTAIIAELRSTRSELASAGAQAPSASVRAHAAAIDSKLGRLISQAVDLETYF